MPDQQHQSPLFSVDMVFERETKGTVVFREVGPDGSILEQGYAIGTLYIRKSILGPKRPKLLSLTITEQG